ncbi:hypothetical protein N7517_010048 [Penicillium concentricum]|uniref:Uncharacterized protein n=1 Tax=Penicillium concentricum TaxID=293559 RepID=A0A9W9RIS3_9EURO|nr:uncharacterized protein N7517_010048 [Penicillium concentricum]KAJ5360857.1 hypothetical protein N7517_010048 [Penicillium concentricum]
MVCWTFMPHKFTPSYNFYNRIDCDYHAAKTLFNAGFCNFEKEEEEEEEEGEEENKGLTTLMRVARSSQYIGRARLNKVLHTIGFLISKGADANRTRREDGRTALHFLGSSISMILKAQVQDLAMPPHSMGTTSMSPGIREKENFEIKWPQLNDNGWDLLETLFMDRHCDSCSCACSSHGCLPCTGIFGELVTWEDSPPNVQAMAELIRTFSDRRGPGSVKTCHDTLAPTVLRVCIFGYLELTHTCCKRTGGWENTVQRAEMLDDFSHIRDEQRLLIKELEKLTAFFMSKYHEMGLGLPEFLLEYWSVEIRKVSKPDPEEIERIKSIGVVLDE